MRRLTLTVFALFLVACASAAAESRGIDPSVTVTPSARATSFRDLSQRDGTSFDQAIVIMAKSEMDGVAQEYRWLGEHYPNSRKRMQSLVLHEGHHFDILHITDAAEIEREIYFDITSFFGKH